MSTIVAIDSMTLVWGVRKQGTDEQIQRAKWLFEMLEEEKSQIVVPTVAVAEYLTPIPSNDHAAVLAAMRERFLLAPFDVRAASLAAQLFGEGRIVRTVGKPGARKCLRADSLIIATAVTFGARVFYTGDDDCRTMASKVMEAKGMPTQGPNLFSGV